MLKGRMDYSGDITEAERQAALTLVDKLGNPPEEVAISEASANFNNKVIRRLRDESVIPISDIFLKTLNGLFASLLADVGTEEFSEELWSLIFEYCKNLIDNNLKEAMDARMKILQGYSQTKGYVPLGHFMHLLWIIATKSLMGGSLSNHYTNRRKTRAQKRKIRGRSQRKQKKTRRA